MAAVFNEWEVWTVPGENIPVVDGLVYFGERDADPEFNPITIYSDRELTTVLANPQSTDSSGRTLNKVWLAGRYSIKVVDTNDVFVFQDLDRGSATTEGENSTKEITVADSPYDVQTTDNGALIRIDASGGNVLVNLLGAVTAGSDFEISFKRVDSSANTVTIDGDAAELIDGQSSVTIDYENRSLTLICTGLATGTSWFIKSDAVDNFGTIQTATIDADEGTVDDLQSDNIIIQGSPTNTNPTLRINSEDGLQTSFSTIVDTSVSEGRLRKVADTGAGLLTLEAVPSDGISNATIRLFRDTNTTGTVQFIVLRGDNSNTADHIFETGTSGTLVSLCDNGGDVEINGRLVVPNGQGTPDAVLEDQKSASTDGGTFTSGAWQTRDLNTEVQDPNGFVTLASNEFTVSEDGWVEWRAIASQVGSHQTRLFSVTDAAEVAVGSSEWVSNNNTFCNTSSEGQAAVEAAKTYRIEHRCESTRATDGYGQSVSWGTNVYTQVKYWASY